MQDVYAPPVPHLARIGLGGSPQSSTTAASASGCFFSRGDPWEEKFESHGHWRTDSQGHSQHLAGEGA